MNIRDAIRRYGTQWNRSVVLRAVLTAGSLISTILASGAGTHWR